MSEFPIGLETSLRDHNIRKCVLKGVKMDKSEILKARVSESLHRDFFEVCAAIGRTPAAALRDLVDQFVASRRNLLEGEVKIHIEQPDDYMHGAWRARITLRSAETMRFLGAPVPFPLPRLDARRIHPDDGYAVAAANWDGIGSGLDGVFVDGVWEGHIYSNGIEEADNPTPIAAVAEALKTSVMRRIDAFRSAGDCIRAH